MYREVDMDRYRDGDRKRDGDCEHDGGRERGVLEGDVVLDGVRGREGEYDLDLDRSRDLEPESFDVTLDNPETFTFKLLRLRLDGVDAASILIMDFAGCDGISSTKTIDTHYITEKKTH